MVVEKIISLLSSENFQGSFVREYLVKMRIAICGVLFSLGLMGCGGESEGMDSHPIEGTWSSCTNYEVNSEGYKAFQENGIWSDTYTQYLGQNCEVVDESEAVVINTGTYTLGDEIAFDGLEHVYEVTWFFDGNTEAPCFTIVGVENGVLYYGEIDNEFNCNSPSERPIDLDFAFPHFKE